MLIRKREKLRDGGSCHYPGGVSVMAYYDNYRHHFRDCARDLGSDAPMRPAIPGS
jgi:hypothetical protein